MPLLVLREILNRILKSHVKLWLNLNSTGYLVDDIAFYPAVCHVSKGQCLDSDLGGICSCCLMYDLNLNHPFVLLELQCHHPWLPSCRDKVRGMTMRSCLALPLCHTQRVNLASSSCDIPDPHLASPECLPTRENCWQTAVFANRFTICSNVSLQLFLENQPHFSAKMLQQELDTCPSLDPPLQHISILTSFLFISGLQNRQFSSSSACLQSCCSPGIPNSFQVGPACLHQGKTLFSFHSAILQEHFQVIDILEFLIVLLNTITQVSWDKLTEHQ